MKQGETPVFHGFSSLGRLYVAQVIKFEYQSAFRYTPPVNYL